MKKYILPLMIFITVFFIILLIKEYIIPSGIGKGPMRLFIPLTILLIVLGGKFQTKTISKLDYFVLGIGFFIIFILTLIHYLY